MALSAGDETRDVCVLRHNLSASYMPRTQKILFKETVLKGFQKVISILTLLVQGHVTHTGWDSQEGGRIFAKQRRENKEQKVFSKQRRGPKMMSCLLPRRVRKQREGMNTRTKGMHGKN